MVLGFDALTRCVCGAYDAAIEHAEKAMQLSPLEPLAYHAAFALPWLACSPAAPEEAVDMRARRSKATATSSSLIASWPWRWPGSAVPMRRRRRCSRLARAAPSFRLGSLRKIRFADAGASIRSRTAGPGAPPGLSEGLAGVSQKNRTSVKCFTYIR